MDSGRVSDFIGDFLPSEEGLLREMREYAEADGIPIIRRETAAFLRSIVVMIRPHRILELGTAIGYSSIMMASIGEDIRVIDTIEDWEPRIPLAAKNIEKSGYADKIRLIQGDAIEVMRGMDEPYDMVFIDAAKGQYPDYLAEAMRLTCEGSVIIADNILQDGEIMESKYLVERRDRTIHKRMREFLDAVTSDDRLATSIIPIGDGITLSVRVS